MYLSDYIEVSAAQEASRPEATSTVPQQSSQPSQPSSLWRHMLKRLSSRRRRESQDITTVTPPMAFPDVHTDLSMCYAAQHELENSLNVSGVSSNVPVDVYAESPNPHRKPSIIRDGPGMQANGRFSRRFSDCPSEDSLPREDVVYSVTSRRRLSMVPNQMVALNRLQLEDAPTPSKMQSPGLGIGKALRTLGQDSPNPLYEEPRDRIPQQPLYAPTSGVNFAHMDDDVLADLVAEGDIVELHPDVQDTSDFSVAITDLDSLVVDENSRTGLAPHFRRLLAEKHMATPPQGQRRGTPLGELQSSPLM
ncbi:uncharacterized protein MONBRDRAFT_36752 [Monosiga brevicollis MX1]|uniref:Uncharacterized protein n=1 Tax=Monosiga brevicollis TaxID=81824 RepID=A9UXA3_MONBE|nr:uncharacterized protein MONBRDRAFT_36752 [Monosiga brevicollis MX1]EDQ90354.1 predicted protein [Monosiga brevicollis MX1]|eukprot:XP_001745121.1 hypothetical protein [Monosiga brevicollis MX1]